jgi:hypothetical protein
MTRGVNRALTGFGIRPWQTIRDREADARPGKPARAKKTG